MHISWRTRGLYWDYNFIKMLPIGNLDVFDMVFDPVFYEEVTLPYATSGIINFKDKKKKRPLEFCASAFMDPAVDRAGRFVRHFIIIIDFDLYLPQNWDKLFLSQVCEGKEWGEHPIFAALDNNRIKILRNKLKERKISFPERGNKHMNKTVLDIEVSNTNLL